MRLRNVFFAAKKFRIKAKAESSRKKFREGSQQQIQQYTQAHPIRRLQLGCGPNRRDGWLNTDIERYDIDVVYLDSTKPFPIGDSLFDYVFSEHHLEHFEYDVGIHMLSESFRILKPRGRIRIATPDLGFLTRLHTPKKSQLQQRYIQWAAAQFLPEGSFPEDSFVINHFFRAWGHMFIYDPATLEKSLLRCGFQNPRLYRPKQSDDPQLKDVEQHGRLIGEDFNQLETFAMEAEKPGPKTV